MTLYANALHLIRTQLMTLSGGQRVTAIEVGQFTPEQHSAINALRTSKGFHPLESPVIVFIGSHLYKSRIVQDGYTIDDAVAQLASAFSATSEVVHTTNMTALRSTVKRADGYGNMVTDEAVFELTQRKPKAELYSVVPKGDVRKIKNKK